MLALAKFTLLLPTSFFLLAFTRRSPPHPAPITRTDIASTVSAVSCRPLPENNSATKRVQHLLQIASSRKLESTKAQQNQLKQRFVAPSKLLEKSAILKIDHHLPYSRAGQCSPTRKFEPRILPRDAFALPRRAIGRLQATPHDRGLCVCVVRSPPRASPNHSLSSQCQHLPTINGLTILQADSTNSISSSICLPTEFRAPSAPCRRHLKTLCLV